jgi:hypothetical protein
VRGALLSARLFADTLEDPQLRDSGMGTMPIEEALEVLAADGRLDVDARWKVGPRNQALTRSLTRFRVAGALKELLVAPGDVEAARKQFIDDVAAKERPFTKGEPYGEVQRTVARLEGTLGESEELKQEMLDAFRDSREDAKSSTAHVRGKWAALELTAATIQEQDRVKQASQKRRLLDLIDDGIRPTLDLDYPERLDGIKWSPNGPTRKYEGPIKWKTDVRVEPNGSTMVSSSIEFKEVPNPAWHRLSHLGDPRNWSRASIFWDKSEAAPEAAKQAPLAEESEWSEGMPGSWKAPLTEVVSAVVRFTARLNVSFEVDESGTGWTAQYDLISSPDGLTRDEGFVTAVRASDGSVRCDVLKRIDFRNGPFGGLSTLDLFAPSYLGSWVRVQQDVWAGEVMAKAATGSPG